MRLSTAVRGRDSRFRRSSFPMRRDWTTDVGLFFLRRSLHPRGQADRGPRARHGASSVAEDRRRLVENVLGTFRDSNLAWKIITAESRGLSHAEIARITETEVATVRWRLFRARRVLQKLLKEWAPDTKGSGT